MSEKKKSNPIKKLVFIIVLIAILVAGILLWLYNNGKKKMDIIFTMSQNMYDINLGEVDNLYTKTINNDGYYETYTYNKSQKTTNYSETHHIKNIEVITDSTCVEYLETDDQKTKIKCLREYDYSLDEREPSSYSFDDQPREFFEIIKYGLQMKVSTESLDGVECYVIDYGDGEKQYVEKESLLPLRIIFEYIDEEGNKVTEETSYTIKKGIVKEEDIKVANDEEFTTVEEEEFDNKYEELLNGEYEDLLNEEDEELLDEENEEMLNEENEE